MMRALLVIALVLAASAAHADSAQDRLDSGLRHFAAKEYAEAIADFKAGFALEPRPDFLYAWAQAERLGGNCAEAVRLYERYLATGVTAEQAKVTADNIAKCHKIIAEQPPPPPASAPAPPPPPPSPPSPPPPPPPPRPWYTDTFADVLVAGGLVAAGAGVVLIATSSSAADDAMNAPTYAAYADRIDGAKTQRAVALVAVGAGAALVTAGVLHYVLRDARVEVAASFKGLGVVARF